MSKSEIGLAFILDIYKIKNTDLAEKLGCSKQLITEWISGRKPIPKKRLESLSKIFNGIIPEWIGRELTDDEKQIINEKYQNDKVIEILEEKRSVSFNGEFGFREFYDLILSLYKKMMYDEKDAQILYRKMDMLETFINLLLEDKKGNNIMWEIMDLLSQDIDEFKEDLFELVEKYEDYL